MDRIFVWIYEFFRKRKYIYFTILISAFILLAFFASRIRLEEDISKMIPNDGKISNYHSTLSKSRFLDKIVVSISMQKNTSQDTLIQCVDLFIAELQAFNQKDSLIAEIKASIDDTRLTKVYDLLYRNLPMYLSDQDYLSLDSLTTEQGIQKAIEADYHRLISPSSFALKNTILKDPLGITYSALSKLRVLQADENFVLHKGYIFKKDLKTALVFISPRNSTSETHLNNQMVEQIKQSLNKISDQHQDVSVQYFGATAVAVANATQIQKDIKVTVSIAVVVIMVTLFLFYRNYLTPILVLAPVVFGVLFSLTMVYFIQGSLSAVALGAGAVILGIAIDYAFHVIAHYQHTYSVKDVIKDITFPMLIGSLSTVGAFFSLYFVKSEVLKDFGLFSGFSLIGAALYSLIFLPFLIEKTSGWQYNIKSLSFLNKIPLLDWILYKPERNKYIAGGIILLTCILFYYSDKVGFESNLAALNYMPEELRKAEQDLYHTANKTEKNIYLIVQGEDLNEAIAFQEQTYTKVDSLQKAGLISHYSGITGLIPSQTLQKQRIQKWKAFWTPEKIAFVKKRILSSSAQIGFKPETFQEFYKVLDTQYTNISEGDLNFLTRNLLSDYMYQDSTGVYTLASIQIKNQNLNKISQVLDNKKYLTVIDRQLLYNKFVEIIKQDFDQILLSCSLLVFVILLVSYGRIELTMVTFIPMLISWVWILGFMGIFDIRFNIVNIIISTFVFGLGDDYAIFFTDGLKSHYAENKENLPSYKISVFLSAFTTIVGMGVLIFAKHPALQSIALISIIGILCVLVISYTMIPLLFKWIITDRTSKGLRPLTLLALIRTLMVYIYFLAGCLLLVAIGHLLFTLFRLQKNKSVMTGYHSLLMYFVRSLIYGAFFIPKKTSNPDQEIFKKPAIIIANHQSFLDILLLLTLYPKIILFTNDWVWNSPFFGSIVKMAGFYNASHGIESSIDHVRELVDDGYSIAIFPEGTRSEDYTMHRFHKGAFYLAEKLELDIVPVVLHGTGEAIHKKDFILEVYPLTISILPRITPANMTYGDTYQEKAKQVRRYMSQHYSMLDKTQPMSVLSGKILSSYLYKSPVLEWYCRIKTSLEHHYSQFDKLIPDQATILDLGCGYGFLDYYLSLRSEERKIIGVDYDEDKISIATHSYLKNDRLSFIAQDVLTYNLPDTDIILLLDVLHYLPPTDQQTLILRCIQKLSPGGMLVIRDGNKEDVAKHKNTQLTEIFSIKIFRFNKSVHKEVHFLSATDIQTMLATENVDIQIVKDSDHTSNVIYKIIKR
ncbi:MMPL family transporter [Cytophagaceae bacterium DM2B3-1]|uniref:MMPL family transporter n=1 Tax=Xanthocytophaga flava TaxID=3048013 RepID=A0ABT7CT71_9BACT|nr:MMPL family transporter [Xanthocytophaga flavus]MDJ1472179.1 MMPL family transporter [Xanthocytophaga flavus]MDJ1496963.1 MMPL family transporter [Xanthocytophaga flavus]